MRGSTEMTSLGHPWAVWAKVIGTWTLMLVFVVYFSLLPILALPLLPVFFGCVALIARAHEQLHSLQRADSGRPRRISGRRSSWFGWRQPVRVGG